MVAGPKCVLEGGLFLLCLSVFSSLVQKASLAWPGHVRVICQMRRLQALVFQEVLLAKKLTVNFQLKISELTDHSLKIASPKQDWAGKICYCFRDYIFCGNWVISYT